LGAPQVRSAAGRPPSGGGGEDGWGRPPLGGAKLDAARGRRQVVGAAGDLPGPTGAVELLVARPLEVRAAVLSPRRDEPDDRVDGLRPEPLRDEGRWMLVEAPVELLEARDHRELQPHS